MWELQIYQNEHFLKSRQAQEILAFREKHNPQDQSYEMHFVKTGYDSGHLISLLYMHFSKGGVGIFIQAPPAGQLP